MGEDFREKFKSQIEYLQNLKDEDIDYSDAPATTDFTNWKPNRFFKPRKAALSAKIDVDVLVWLKTHKNYSKYLNDMCRRQMNIELSKEA